MTQVLIRARFDAKYYTHYIDALRALVGGRRVRYSLDGFPSPPGDGLALRVGSPERRIYLHSDDAPTIDQNCLDWCDVYGKVNLDPESLPVRGREKLVAMGPTFTFRSASWLPLAVEGLRTYWAARRETKSFSRHIAAYRGIYSSRFPESAYAPSPSASDYVFYNAAVWEREPKANKIRANFVEAGRSVAGITFEGGLSARASARGTPGWAGPGFERYFAPRCSPAEYLERTKRSAVAMNNPAYRDCHSWRLAEYLALGKAVITTPFKRAVPAPLEHRSHVHVVDGSVESFREAIEEICADHRYRAELEKNARSYYEEYLHPIRVMERVLSKAGFGPDDFSTPKVQHFEPEWTLGATDRLDLARGGPD